MGLRADQSQRLVALFVLGALLLTYPLLSLFNRSELVFGVPLLYAYLFGAWALLVALMALAAGGGGPRELHDGANAPTRAGTEAGEGAGTAPSP